jgi:TRAP-type C4-dicarboxylate transport system permease small subunit
VVELKPPASIAKQILFLVGAGALLLIMAVDTLAVIGRHIGWPLLGAIEIIQAAILIVACTGTVIATLGSAHATVHLLTDRLRPGLRLVLERFAALLAAMFFLALTGGAAWLAIDLWNAHEESELLHIPFRPLRALIAIAVMIAAAIFAYRSAVNATTRKRSAQ